MKIIFIVNFFTVFFQHQIIPSTTDTSLTSSTAVADDMERTDEMSRSNSVKDEVAGASSGEDSGVLLHQSSPTHEVAFKTSDDYFTTDIL